MQQHEAGGIPDQGSVGVPTHLHHFEPTFARSHAPLLNLASSVDKILCLMGDETERALVFHIEEESGLELEQLLRYPVMFTEALGRILGKGAYVLETMILEELKSAKSSSEAHRAMVEQLEISTRPTSTFPSTGWGH